MGLQIGNVYAHFREEDQAAAALRGMTGRFYAGICLSSSSKFVFMYETSRKLGEPEMYRILIETLETGFLNTRS